MSYRSILPIFIILLFIACSPNKKGTIQVIQTPAAENSHLPFLTSDQAGNIFVSWVETDTTENQSTLRYAKLGKSGWTESNVIATSDQWFVNWADYPSIIAHDDTVVAAHTLHKIPGNTYSYNVNIYVNKEGASWSNPVTPHFDSTATEHGFVSMTPRNDDIMAIWLDGRRSENRTENEYFDIDKAMTLRSAVIKKNGSVVQKKLIDSSVCDCCNTSVALTSKGPVAAYRNRTDGEIRDIYVSRFVNEKWTKPKAIYNDNWKIGACPVNGPAIAANDSTVVAAWYTAAGGKRLVKASISTDYGESFSELIIINDAQAIGRVDAVINAQGKAFVSWMESSNEQAHLKVKAIEQNRTASKAMVITSIEPSRKSGFPQMELSARNLVFAWTHIDGSGSIVKTAQLSVSDFK